VTSRQQEALDALASGEGPLLLNLEQEADELTDHRDQYPEIVEQLRELARQRMAAINETTVPLWKPSP